MKSTKDFKVGQEVYWLNQFFCWNENIPKYKIIKGSVKRRLHKQKLISMRVEGKDSQGHIFGTLYLEKTEPRFLYLSPTQLIKSGIPFFLIANCSVDSVYSSIEEAKLILALKGIANENS